MAAHAIPQVLDAGTSNLDIDGNTTHSFSYTLPAGSVNRLVILCLGEEDDVISSTLPVTATFNAASMTELTHSQTNDAADDPGCHIFAYSPGSLAAGAYTAAITYTANIKRSQAFIFTIDNVNPTVVQDATAVVSNGDAGTSVADAIVTVTDRAFVLQALCTQNTDTSAPTDGQIVLFNSAFDSAGNLLVAYLIPTAAGSRSMNATFTSNDFANALVAIRPRRRHSRVA
jgi:hypothetical protein